MVCGGVVEDAQGAVVGEGHCVVGLVVVVVGWLEVGGEFEGFWAVGFSGDLLWRC